MTTEEKINQLQAQIDELRKEVKPKFEVGKWYRGAYGQTLFFLTKLKNDKQYGYGFDAYGKWYNLDEDLTYWKENNAIPATDKEVEEALIKEAERRGFKEGVGFNPVVENVRKDKVGTVSDKIVFFAEPQRGYEQGLASGKNWIFYQGKWAEIIKDEPIKVGGYEVKKGLFNDCVIGCKKINLVQVHNIRVFMKEYDFKKVAFDGITVDLETIEKILKM